MEDNRTLFSLSIDPASKSHLIEAARWARILAFGGIVSLVSVVVAGILQVLMFDRVTAVDDQFSRALQDGKYAIVFFYLIILFIAFFPIYYIFRFSGQMRKAMYSNEQESFNEALLNLKLYFRFLGILTLIGFGFFILMIIIGMSAALFTI